MRIRHDGISDKFMIVKPGDEKAGSQSYAPGKESTTEPSVLSLVVKDGVLQRFQDGDDDYVRDWSVRVFESGAPIVSTDSGNNYGERPCYSDPAYGYHYVVAASRDPKENFSTMSAEQWSNILVAVQDRLRWLYTKKGVTYVSIFLNYGRAAGAENAHPHLNIVTFPSIPPVIDSEIKSFQRVMNETGTCPLCEMINHESMKPLQILEHGGYSAFCPWTSSYPYEFWISPTKHVTSFSKTTQKALGDLSLMLRATLGGLAGCIDDLSFNLVFHLSPEKKQTKHIHWHIEVYPITRQISGLERGFGIFLNDLSPEDAAEKLGTACRKEIANLVGIT